jgi:transcription elongation GreA/GreB family factor
MPGDASSTTQDSSSTSTLFTGSIPIKAALNELRLRLLDLTGRNRLINFKHTAGKSLQFVHSSIDGTFQRLIADQNSRVAISPLPEPDRSDWVSRGGRLSRPEPKEHAVRVGIDPSFELFRRQGRAVAAANSGSQVRTLFYAEDLGRHSRKLEREAKSAIEETGANMLYLVFGMLEFPEAPDSDKLYRAPLVCLPVNMTRVDEGQYSSFYLNYTGEELASNLSLHEKVKRDYGLNLPEHDSDEESSVEAYLEAVSDAVAQLPNWRVRRMMTLTLLSFTNMLLVRDLDPENWPKGGQDSALLEHPLVKQVFEGKAATGEAQYADEYDTDTHPKANLPLIYDADSSQHSALIDVLEGKNRVIEGPPGTGKSQTITNLIAAALQAGKKVLFVAEKLAALEVVKSRLALSGLDPFILELHSNKTNKKRVLEDLAKRVNLHIQSIHNLPDLLERQDQKRRELKAYADLMNTKVAAALDMTLHQVMWRSERNRLRAENSAAVVQQLDYPAAPRTTPAQLSALVDRLRYLADQLEPIGTFSASHPLWGFFPAEFKPEDDIPVQRVLSEFAAKFEAFADSMGKAAELLGGSNLNMSTKSADQLVAVLSDVAPADAQDVAFWLLPSLFSESDPRGTRGLAALLDLSERAAAIDAAEADVLRNLLHNEPPSDSHAAAATSALQGVEACGLGSLDAKGIGERREQIQTAAEGAEEALKILNDAAQFFGVPFDWSAGPIAKVAAIVDVVESAPRDCLHLQHPGLRGQTVVSALERAVAQHSENLRRYEFLSTRFYMDALPSDEVLSTTILTFREGDAWYRFMQKRWRNALRVHRTLQQQKTKLSAAERQLDLERIRSLLKDQHAWRNDAELRSVSGPHFKDEQTPLEQLISLGRWVQTSDAALESAQVSAMVFDPTRLDRVALTAMQARLPAIRSALSALSEFEGTCQRILGSARVSLTRDLFDVDWKRRLAAADAAAKALAAAERSMEGYVRAGVAVEKGLRAIATKHSLPRVERELADAEEGRALFGDAYAGRRTNFEAALAAHTYGTLVKKAGLPSTIERVILSPDCVANHWLLTAYTNGIAGGWQAVSDFAAAMSRFGRFEPAAWAEPTGRSTSQYAKALAVKTRNAADKVGGLLAWAQYVGARDDVIGAGLEGFVARLESGTVPPGKLEYAFLYRFYASIAQVAFERSAPLRQFSGRRHSSVRKDFADLDKEVIKLRGLQVAQDCRAQSNPPAGTTGVRVDDKTEMELLRHLMPQQRPRVPVRKMLQRAGRAIQELKPCFMMGPQAVAQFLAPGRLHFDIVVMDEASQLRPEEAIGAIARGSQLVVVGDPKQLPPTSFFSRMGAVEDDGEEGLGALATSEAESILDVCISHFQPVRTLRWHYRSRHESLIAFSNHHFYRGNLVVFPSPYPKSRALGLRYQYVSDGIYVNQMNHVEARRVVDAAVDHILNRPDDSLGIVTLNIKQRDLVAELLEERLRSLPEAADFKERWEAEGMGPFVKNLENVQGDERDCILISTTFGKSPGSNAVRQNFGPISRDGGWRRLNVLFTRSRKSVAVFSSMRPEDIVVDSKTPEGTRALRNYLEFARNGVLPVERETGLPPDSDFEIAVMDVLRGKGYEVEPQLGVAGFRIDIGVKHPEHRSGYLAAVECDGASYHSGVSVRDRDRIRQEILESLGWRNRIWRIWSTDWFRSPLNETQRLVQFLEELRQQPIAEEYLFEVASTQESAPPDKRTASDEEAEKPENLVFEDEDEALEVRVGDLVTYAPVGALDQHVRVRLTARQTNPSLGLVAESTPLGAVLMGATVGETIVLRVPGTAPQPFVVQGIKRSTEETAQ